MNQEKIGKRIKELRLKEKISQQKFAEKYGVTFQAVSKWENGKNIPDIAILKQICQDYQINLNELLDGVEHKNKWQKNLKIFLFTLLLLGGIIWLFWKPQQEAFEFKTLSTNCSNFNIVGSIAYSQKKSAIYISEITYCNEQDQQKYQSIECTLFEANENIQTEINKYRYEKQEAVTLKNFLKEVNFVIDNFEKTCKTYKENSLYLEIKAEDQNKQTTTYKIPLQFTENCP
ncbi:MAG: helix-turn-helix transcriptional regulator [Bacilli bacterium]|nr:helix-turn-helix transcriptional regulator [Bacilli bacterium]